MAWRRILGLLTVLATAILVADAGAGVVNRAAVGVSGRNDTKGYSPALAVVFSSPPDYVVDCCVDSDSGTWKGPPYASTSNANLGGDSKISWRAVFTRTAQTAGAAARANLVQNWPEVSTTTAAVPHTVAGRRVGSIPAFVLATRSPGFGAQVEVALAFPLCPGLQVVADFDLLSPQQDGDGLGGQYLVQNQVASAWNEAQAEAALAGVSLDGNLPPGKVTARRAGRRVVGKARDCRGHPLVGVPVRLVPGGRSTRTSATGTFALPAPKQHGRYRVTVSLAGRAASARVTAAASSR